MSEMVEQVARAIATNIRGECPPDELISLWEVHARAAIVAVRDYFTANKKLLTANMIDDALNPGTFPGTAKNTDGASD